ncbi:MAG: YfhO family protein [Chloroflexota bacterium]|nr:YfhO family protein [Chloroflexota bacterium]
MQDAPNRVTIRAALDAPGYLVLADTYYPGWRAMVDGDPADILRANYSFRAVWLEAGEHVVEMTYRPTSALAGGAISLAALVLLGVGLLLTRR